MADRSAYYAQWRKTPNGRAALARAQEKFRASAHGKAARVLETTRATRSGLVRQRWHTWRAKRAGAFSDGSVARLWKAIVASHSGRCAYCDTERAEQMDHVVPFSRGGAHVASNVVPACLACNNKKQIEIWLPRPASSVAWA